ncbi:hypothetical protein HB818_14460 [Listeria booriae]|uniref:hypothetical protein n=1 Tax=Listeria booriae TaxID=1552123 RepID=UPI0016259601|nr:hypothetical protein [Listeria booriae]MBC1286962.1 hypothetical protein [Listeria booriae]
MIMPLIIGLLFFVILLCYLLLHESFGVRGKLRAIEANICTETARYTTINLPLTSDEIRKAANERAPIKLLDGVYIIQLYEQKKGVFGSCITSVMHLERYQAVYGSHLGYKVVIIEQENGLINIEIKREVVL